MEEIIEVYKSYSEGMVHHCIGLQPERHISTKLRKRKRTNQLSATVPWKDFRHKAQLRMMSCCGEQLSDSLTSFASGSKGQIVANLFKFV